MSSIRNLFKPSVVSLAVLYTGIQCFAARGLGSSVKICKRTDVLQLSHFSSTTSNMSVRFLKQQEAIDIDNELFNEYQFSVDQLMEMAGISVATAVAKVYGDFADKSVLVICGPGNNGGDGLVAARHLKLFGFQNVTILCTRKPKKDLFVRLVHQAEMNDVKVVYELAELQNASDPSLVIDALFGFSFKPPVREDVKPHLKLMADTAQKCRPVVAVDIPSGWDVEQGPATLEKTEFYYMPDMLVSLTAPKECARHFKGRYHYLGGRFVPKRLTEKYAMNLPAYPNQDCVVEI